MGNSHSPRRASPAVLGPGGASDLSWLVLTHHLPPEPAYHRVKVRRQLERIGAIPLKNSVYVLPLSEETREDFEWLGREIERYGGETTLCVASFLDEATDARVLRSFREAREADYREIAGVARELQEQLQEESMKEKRQATARSRGRKLRRRLAKMESIDFFDAPGREDAERAISDLESLAREEAVPSPGAPADRPAPPVGATWVTREGAKVDRMASAWLIRRFIDPSASFKFVPARGYRPDAGELRFDMFDGEFTHVGDRCTFETLLEHFALDEPALVALGEIVHDIDCKDEKFGRSEVAGIDSLVHGITRVCETDEERIERGLALFENLYEHFRSEPR